MDFRKTVEKFETRVKRFLTKFVAKYCRQIFVKFSLSTLAYNKMFTAVSLCRTYNLFTEYAFRTVIYQDQGSSWLIAKFGHGRSRSLTDVMMSTVSVIRFTFIPGLSFNLAN